MKKRWVKQQPKPDKHMTEVARLLTDMAEAITVCDKTLVYVDEAVQKQQQKVERSKGAK